MSDTPETEEAKFVADSTSCVLASFARKLERERDELKRELEQAYDELLKARTMKPECQR